jgi:class 3 adenylate cyclase
MNPVTPELRSRIVAFLESDEERLVKYAIQRLCEVLEADRRLTLSPVVVVALARHLYSPHLMVRRWLYKLVALSGERRYVPWLHEQLRSERDPENLSWAVAALFALEPRDRVAARLASLNLVGQPYALCARFFGAQLAPVPERLEREAAEAEEPLPAMWLALLYARNRGLVRPTVIRALSGHHQPAVSEYSIWSVVRSPDGGLADIEVGPGEFAARTPQVRRWLYRLLGKDPGNLAIYADFIAERIERESDPRAREGLALALGAEVPPAPLVEAICEWAASEEDPLTKVALGDHLRLLGSGVPAYREALEVLESDPALLVASSRVDDVFLERTGKVSAVPRPRDVEARESYLIGLDTVGFSKLSDHEQFAVLQDILAACDGDPDVQAAGAANATFVITGDGVIGAFTGIQHALAPLRMALRIADRPTAAGEAQFRFGVHAGPVNWIELESGERQLSGNSVNWTVRVMDAAEEANIYVSEAYYDLHAHPRRDQLSVGEFRAVEGLVTKHDEPLRVYAVRP